MLDLRLIGELDFGRNIVDSSFKNCSFDRTDIKSDLKNMFQDRCWIFLQILKADEVGRDLADNAIHNVFMALGDVFRLHWHPFIPPVWVVLIVIANELQSIVHREKILTFS